AANAPAVAAASLARGVAFDPLETQDAQGSTFEIEMALLSLDDMKLFFADGLKCGDFDDFEFISPVACSGNHVLAVGPLMIDLTTGDSVPSLNDLTIPLVGFDQVNMKTIPGDPEMGVVMEGGPLDGVTLYLEGTLTCAGGFTVCTGTHAFSTSLTFNSNVPFMGAPFTVDEATKSIRLNLETDDWFSALDITQCLEDADLNFEMDDSLIIANGGNPCDNIENAMKNAFAASAKFGEVVGGTAFAPESLPEGDHEEGDDE
ncbi:MAG: hypothetical protein KDH09_19150, partial [Chrysiogenetes bacterium]|nr:hypothetical protein [Chrysiogenetes bacterium]